MNSPTPASILDVCVLNASGQADYLYGLVNAVAMHSDVRLHVIVVDGRRLPERTNIHVLSIGPDRCAITSKFRKAVLLVQAYYSAFRQVASCPGTLVHMQWPIRFEIADRVLI